MRRISVILNPAARGGRALAEFSKLPQQLNEQVQVATTELAGDARTLARRAVAEGFDTVVAAGGDGTINEVVNGLGDAPVALGVLPMGTMNVFAAELSLPSSLEEAWQVIEQGHTRVIDLACANQQRFVQLAGVGLDAQAVKETSWDMKRTLGPLSYLVSAAQVMARKPPRLQVTADSARQEEGSFMLVGNGRYYGGRIEFFKEAKLDDGLLDVLIFQKAGHLDIAWYIAHILMGRLPPSSDVVYLQARKLQVHSDEAVPVELDGELASETPLEISLAPHGLRVLVTAV